MARKNAIERQGNIARLKEKRNNQSYTYLKKCATGPNLHVHTQKKKENGVKESIPQHKETTGNCVVTLRDHP